MLRVYKWVRLFQENYLLLNLGKVLDNNFVALLKHLAYQFDETFPQNIFVFFWISKARF